MFGKKNKVNPKFTFRNEFNNSGIEHFIVENENGNVIIDSVNFDIIDSFVARLEDSGYEVENRLVVG